MLLGSLFDNFVKRKPDCVMARAALERMLAVSRLDELFRAHATVPSERDLLFSQSVEVMARVVTRVDRSVPRAVESLRDVLTVSDEAVSQKLRGVETGVSPAVVRDSFREASAVLRPWKVADRTWARGFRVKIPDGNHLAATQPRIAELRTIWDAPWPGRALVVWDQVSRLVGDVFLTEDGHASERSLPDEAPDTVERNDLWIADRNFCTPGFLFGLWSKRARFVIRQHGRLAGRPVGERTLAGQTARGEKVDEQRVVLADQGRERTVRRVTVQLRTPTRDGDTELHIFTNLTAGEANGAQVADLSQKRWTIEAVFQELTTALPCQVNTLGDPKAALVTFCVAVLLENTPAMLKGSLRAAPGEEATADLSGNLLSDELQTTDEGLRVAIPAEHWTPLATMTLALGHDDVEGVRRDPEVVGEASGSHPLPSIQTRPEKTADATQQRSQRRSCLDRQDPCTSPHGMTPWKPWA